MAKLGRPLKITEAVVAKLEEAFSFGCTDEEACFYAGCAMATLYKYQKNHPDFTERKKLLKTNPTMIARQSVIRGLESDHNHALRYLERKKKDEFSLRQEMTGADGDDFKGVVIYVPKEDEE
jgi:hypothetical protein